MREHKFRGKRLDNGEWVYGFFVIDIDKKHFIIHTPYRWDALCQAIAGNVYEVDPETVGQYTGLPDQNKKETYDGDIIKILACSDGLGTYWDPPKSNGIAVVKWGMCAWMWETTFIVGGMEDRRYITFPEAWCHWKCEVVGNVYDNPELIAVERKKEAQNEG